MTKTSQGSVPDTEVGGLLDRKGKLVSTLSLYRFVDLMEILYKGDQR